jgi:hypothetical protein
MDLTGGTRTMAGAGGAATVGGLSVVLYGTLNNDVTRTIGGTCITIVALTIVALILLRHWIVDTSEERRILGAAQRAAQAERARYFAAQAALENEQGRLHQDMAAERASLTARLQAEREAMAAEFEEQRASLVAETMEATFLMFHNGKFAPAAQRENKVIQLREHQQRHPVRERSREHGVASPETLAPPRTKA